MQLGLLRFSKIGPPGLDKKRKSEKYMRQFFNTIPLKMAKNSKQQKISGLRGLKNQCGTKSSDLFHISPERTFL